MIALSLPARAEPSDPYVARLSLARSTHPAAATAIDRASDSTLFSGPRGLFEVNGVDGSNLEGDVVIVDPSRGRVDRVLRRGSRHNTLLVTERCDQLCVMCSQPPKKTHHDRFALFAEACLLAEPSSTIGLTGGEPTLYKDELLSMIERVIAARPDLSFHVLTNGQHFDRGDVARLRDPRHRRVQWGIPLYAPSPEIHDAIVAKDGAFDKLHDGMATLLLSGASIELRTVILSTNAHLLPELARHVSAKLPFVDSWSIMGLENIGFAKARWGNLRHDHAADFGPIASALDHAEFHGIDARLFNLARCSVPQPYRRYAAASISDWKRRYAEGCAPCREREVCSGFFEWHPVDEMERGARPL